MIQESGIARLRRIVRDSPPCECGSFATVSERHNGKTLHYCLQCFAPIPTSSAPHVTEAEIESLLEVL
jgi:hypothetical protein